MLGNNSKDAKSWLNGPTHEIRNQCLPGYTGFVPGIKSENLFSATYASNTARSFANKIPRGDASPEERYKTVTGDKFGVLSNRRIMDNPQFSSRRDFLEYTISVNNQFRDKRDKFIASPAKASAALVSPAHFGKDLNGSPYSHV